MNLPVTAVSCVAGAAAGALSGAAAVAVERVERLREEEDEERLAYQRDVAEAAAAAEKESRPQPDAPPWRDEQYGWTWLERWLAPLLTAALYGAFAAREGPGRGLLIHFLWIAVFVHIVAFDLKHRLILNRITYPAIVLALLLSPVTPGLSLLRALIGGAAVFLFFFAQNLLSRGSIGLGDAKLGALVGAITGLSLDGGDLRAVYAAFYAILLGGGIAILLVITRLRRLKDPIPYGPFLCAGAALVLYQTPS